MNYIDALRIAIGHLLVNRLRSGLTVLGIMIGVGSVVGTVSIGEGTRRMIVAEFGKLGGSNLIVVSPKRWMFRDGLLVPATDYQPLTLEDVNHVKSASEKIVSVVPRVSVSGMVRHWKSALACQVVGTSPAYSRALEWPVSDGRFLSSSDIDQARTICVLGHSLSQALFAGTNPLGEEVRLNGQRYTVVGVFEERDLFGRDWGNRIIVPVTTAQYRILGSGRLDELMVRTAEITDTFGTMSKIRKELTRYHGSRADYLIESGKGILDQVEQTILVVKLVAGGIAGISLLVGGVGIMNIMLISVSERTREIGIRGALGAKPFDLLLQFGIEALVLSASGGALGVGIGFAFGKTLSHAIHKYVEIALPSFVSLESVVLAMSFSVAVGLFFGLFPAARASRLDPVDALGAE